MVGCWTNLSRKMRCSEPNNSQVELNLAQAKPDRPNINAKLRICVELNLTLARPDRYNNDAKLRRYVELNLAWAKPDRPSNNAKLRRCIELNKRSEPKLHQR